MPFFWKKEIVPGFRAVTLFLLPQAVGILALVGHGLQGGHHHGLVCGVGHAEPAVRRGQHLHGGLAFLDELRHGQGQEILALQGVIRNGFLQERGETVLDFIQEAGHKAPHIHGHGGVGGQVSVFAVLKETDAARIGFDAGTLDDLGEVALGIGLANAPGHAAVFGDGLAQLVAHHAVAVGVSHGREGVEDHLERGLSVIVIGVDNGERRAIDLLFRAEHSVRGTPGLYTALGDGNAGGQLVQLLIGVADFHRRLFQPLADGATVSKLPEANGDKGIWAVQFHPEVFHTVQGTQLLKNFVVDICGSTQSWSAASFVDTTVAELKAQVGDDRVILGLSGGVDSSVAAVLLNRAIGNNLTCIFVDHGMLRKNEFRDVMHDYECLGLNVIGVDASEKFFADLAGVTDPEQKRKIIGRDFVEVFNAEAKKITGAKWLAQGTIYPDRIESLNITGKVIKSHHNVGGLPKEMHLQLCEPLKWLFKDEVRRVGRQLGMPEHLITRHPFPGPGLAVRILGDITPEKVRILQDADDIYIRGLRDYKVRLSGEDARKVLAAGVPAAMTDGEIEVSLYDQIWQAGTVLLYCPF